MSLKNLYYTVHTNTNIVDVSINNGIPLKDAVCIVINENKELISKAFNKNQFLNVNVISGEVFGLSNDWKNKQSIEIIILDYLMKQDKKPQEINEILAIGSVNNFFEDGLSRKKDIENDH